MVKSDWFAVAEILHICRQGAAAGWPPGKDDPNPEAANYRKIVYFTTLETIDRIALLLAARFKAESSRFDEERFLRLIGTRLPQT